MNRKRYLLTLCSLLLLLSLVACGSSDEVGGEPTALPYSGDGGETALALSGGTAPEGDPEAGEVVFENSCSRCHSLEEAVQIVGPSLYAAGERLQFQYIQASIENPHEMAAIDDYSLDMPPDLVETLSTKQLKDVAAFVASLQQE